jgi:TolB-like protein/class 3 adenylate cyclase/cytochrome c-type biogenesis protein CcmH/NrfG
LGGFLTGERIERRLAAILAADVVGYSRLMGRDENGTLARLKAHRTERLEPMLARHGGRLVKLTGDGALVEFPSAVDALSAAIEFQQRMTQANEGHSKDTAIAFRIGLHLGDLIVDGDDLYGDGVNVAARLEAEAPAGGIVISGDMHNAVVGRLKATFNDLGSLTLKNIERPVQAFGVQWKQGDWKVSTLPAAAVPTATPARPSEPLIIVLPFICLGGTADQEAFADGVTESLTTDLSRQRGHSVVARTTAFTFKGKAIDVRQLSRQLGVRYALEGTVQYGADRVRVNVQLIDAGDGAHLWANRFDKELGDLLDIQDEIAERASRAVSVQLREAEIRRAEKAQRGAPDPQNLMRLGYRAFVQGASRANCMRAALLYAEAIKLDSGNPSALALLAIVKHASHSLRWSETPEDDLREATTLIGRAMALDPHLSIAHVASAWVSLAQGKFAAAMATFERVARATPTAGGNALANLAFAKNYVGRSEEAVADLLRVIRITPDDPQMDWWYFYLGQSYVFLGRYQDAVRAFQHRISLNASWELPYLFMAASYTKLDRAAEARDAVRQAMALGCDWTVTRIKASVIFSGIGIGIDDGRMMAFWDGLRLAGLAE